MALVQCAECGREVSDKAAACPGCGAPPPVTPVEDALMPPSMAQESRLEPEDGTKPWKVLVSILAVAAIVIVGVQLASKDEAQRRTDFEGTKVPAPTPPETAESMLRRMQAAASGNNPRDAIEIARMIIAVHPGSSEAEAAAGQLEELMAALRLQESRARWRYNHSEDAMTGRATSTATIRANAPFELDFPYRGAQTASLTLRRHPTYGRDVILQIERGQLVCQVGGCSVSVRFDDRQPMRFRAAGPADHGTTSLFLSPFDRFYQAMRQAKVVRIQPTLYQYGDIVMEFDVSGFQRELFER